MITVGRPRHNPVPAFLNEENAMTNAGGWQLCKALITNVDVEFNLYELTVDHPITGSTFKITDATALKDPQEEGVYQKTERVFVLAPFTEKGRGIEYNKYAGHSIILGSCKWVDVGSTPFNRPAHPDFGILNQPNTKGMYNSYSGCGILFSDSGAVNIISYSSDKTGPARPRTSWNPNGVNNSFDAIYHYASNHHVVIGKFDDPLNRELFGIDDNGGTAATASDFRVCRRSFVTKTMDVFDGFVSTCEGTNDPLWGPNNQSNTITEIGPYIFHKIFDAGKTKNRLEVRIGHTADASSTDFMRMTLMSINDVEKFSGRASANLATRNATLTSRFSFRLAADGSFELWSGNNMPGRGSEQSMKIWISADKDGNLKIQTQKSISLSAGNTTLLLDSNQGISIKDANGHNLQITSTGITVNGKNIVHDALYDLLIAHAADFGLSPAMGPVPINPAVIAEIQAKTIPGVGKLKTNDAAVVEPFSPTAIQTSNPEV